ncbi:MAG: hypothetical protein ABEI57_05310 [Halapricum sp.]
MSQHSSEALSTGDEFEATLQRLLRSADRADVDVPGAYFVESDGTTGVEVHITAVER